MHTEAQLNDVALGCGLALGELDPGREREGAAASDPRQAVDPDAAASASPQWARRTASQGGVRQHAIPAGLNRRLMPKRTDISSILIIGAGPIVIGQAAEFDYSGSQAVKALKAEGYRVIVVNSNPATIMTDPGARRRDLYRADHARDRRQDHREGAARRAAADDGRADRAQHRAGAVQGRHARPARDRADRRQCRGDREGRGPAEVPRGDGQDRARKPALGDRAQPRGGAGGAGDASACRRSSGRASRSAGPAAASPTTATSSRQIVRGGLEASPDHRSADRGIGARLEGI